MTLSSEIHDICGSKGKTISRTAISKALKTTHKPSALTAALAKAVKAGTLTYNRNSYALASNPKASKSPRRVKKGKTAKSTPAKASVTPSKSSRVFSSNATTPRTRTLQRQKR